MGITYKELFHEKDRFYGFGPAGYFIKRFKKSDYSEAELLDLISGMDFSLGEAGEDISLEKKCEIIEQAVAGAAYTSWTLTLIGIVISLVSGVVLSGLVKSSPLMAIALVALFLGDLGVYARSRFCFERDKTALLRAIGHIGKVLEHERFRSSVSLGVDVV